MTSLAERLGCEPCRCLQGLWVTFLDPYGVEIVDAAVATARIPVHWLGIDLQHGNLADSDLPGVLRATRLPALVRSRSHEPAHLARILDSGASGLIVPGVDTAVEAGAIVASAYPPPTGRRSTGAGRSSLLGTARDPVVLAMIETAEGLANRETIAATPGIDGLFVGPYDLSLSLGASGVTAGAVLTAIDEIVATARRHHRFAGLFAGSPELRSWSDRVDLVAVDADVALIRLGLTSLFHGG